MGQVADDAPVADEGREPGAGVDDGAVLNGGAGADGDVPEVAAEDGAGQTLDSEPMTTSPMTTASGWTKASASMLGATPSSS